MNVKLLMGVYETFRWRLIKERLFMLQCRKSSQGHSEVRALGNSRRGCWLYWFNRPIRNSLTVGFGHSAIARDMPSLAAFVAYLACGVERTSIGSSAVTRNVSL